eukprot:998392-Pyramimonas_sp.AAC.1
MGTTTRSNRNGSSRLTATAQRSSVLAPTAPDAQLRSDSLTSDAIHPKIGELSSWIISSVHSTN